MFLNIEEILAEEMRMRLRSELLRKEKESKKEASILPDPSKETSRESVSQ